MKVLKHIFLISFFSTLIFSCDEDGPDVETPTIEISNTFTGTFSNTGDYNPFTVIESHDRGVAITGARFLGGWDAFFILTDDNGKILPGFPKYFGDSDGDFGIKIITTLDRGYAIIGSTEIEGQKQAIFFIKTDKDGEILPGFPKTFGNSGLDIGRAIVQEPNGDFMIMGHTSKNGLDGKDIVFIKTDAEGNVLEGFPLTYGEVGEEDDPRDMIRTSDGDYAIISRASGNTYILKVDNEGKVISGFPKIFERSSARAEISIAEVTDGDLMILTFEEFNDSPGHYLVKIDGNGVIRAGYPKKISFYPGYRMIATDDNGLAFIDNLFIPDSETGGDIYLLKTDIEGNLSNGFTQTYDFEKGAESGTDLCQTSDGGFAIIGRKLGAGDDVVWIKTDRFGNLFL